MPKALQALVVVCIVRLFSRGADLLTGDNTTKIVWDSLSHAPVVWGCQRLAPALCCF